MKKVVVLKIDDYDTPGLIKKLEANLEKHFALAALCRPGDKFLIKPNLLMSARPEEAVVTHPAFIEAVGTIFKTRGARVAIADSPGGFASQKNMDDLYDEVGIKAFARALGFDLLYPDKSVIRDSLPLCWWADPQTLGTASGFKMINAPKLKTHSIMMLTLAAKNLYGCISGLHKSNLHRAHPHTLDFASIIMKLYSLIRPSLNIVDGILAMEGDGPAKNGIPRKLGIVVIGDDALYTDLVIGRLLGLDEHNNPLIKIARSAGLIQERELEVISEVGPRLCSDFRFPSEFILDRVPGPVIGLVKRFLKFKPRILGAKCTKCSKCVEVCPQKAIRRDQENLVIDHEKCIMCMCCAEMCRFGAVDLEQSLLLRIIKKLTREK